MWRGEHPLPARKYPSSRVLSLPEAAPVACAWLRCALPLLATFAARIQLCSLASHPKLSLLVSYRPLALDRRSGPTTRRRGPRPFVLCLERYASSRLWRSLPFCSSLALAAKSGSVSSLFANRQHTEHHFYINSGCILQKNSATYSVSRRAKSSHK